MTVQPAAAPAPDARKRHGVHYTPPELARFLADRVVQALRPGLDLVGEPIRVLDPACGDGALLAAAGARLRAAGHRGIELVGLDRDPAAVAAARRRLAATDPEPGSGAAREAGSFVALRVRDALYGELAGGFHAVITNPPYVRTQLLGPATVAELARRFGLHGRVDLMHVFVALAAEQLTPGGVLGLLCSNRFLCTQAGGNVRRLLAERFRVREVYDLGDSKPFPAAVLPAVVIGTAVPRPTATPQPTHPPPRFVSVYQRPEPPEPSEPSSHAGQPDPSDRRFYTDLCAGADTVTHRAGRSFAVTVGTLGVEPSPAHRWRLDSAPGTRWAERVRRATWRTFGEVTRIRVGIKTTADRVFVRDDWDRLPPDLRPEDELLLPLLTHRTVRAWRGPDTPATRVLYPYDRRQASRRPVLLAEYPRAQAYLERHRDRLAARDYLAKAGREWFEIWVPQRPAGWAAPKIVFPDISVDPRFSVDRSGAVVNGDCYWISSAELPGDDLGYLLVGVANSTLAVRFYDLMCANRLYSGRRRWMTQYVNLLPLPDPGSRRSAEVVRYAKKLCGTSENPDPQLVRQLDELVQNAFLEDQ